MAHVLITGSPRTLTDVARHRNDNKCFVDEVQSFQKIPHFSTELQRKLLGKWLSPLLYQFCVNPLLLGLVLQEIAFLSAYNSSHCTRAVAAAFV